MIAGSIFFLLCPWWIEQRAQGEKGLAPFKEFLGLGFQWAPPKDRGLGREIWWTPTLVTIFVFNMFVLFCVMLDYINSKKIA